MLTKNRTNFGKSALSLCLLGGLLWAQPALATSPVGSVAAVPSQAQDQAPAKKEISIEKLVQQAGARCSSNPMARTRVVHRDCPAKMEAVAKLGDRAVPALVQQLAAVADSRQIFNDSASVYAALLGRIGTPAAIGALIDTLGRPGLSNQYSSIPYYVHNALLTATKAHIKGEPRDEAGTKRLYQAWLKWRDDQQKPST